MPFLAQIAGQCVARNSKLKLARSGEGWSTYQGGSYCGPGWGYTYQDLLDGKIAQMPEAIDAIDAACRAHDACYMENGYFTQGCNLVLSVDLAKVVADPNSTAMQRVDAAVMAAVFFVESQTIDLGVMGWREMNKMRERTLGYMGRQLHTLEQAIQREMLGRRQIGF